MRTDTIYSIEYWTKRGLNDIDAQRKVEESKKETSWRCKEFWIKRGFTDIEALDKISLKQREISFKRDRNKKLPNIYSPDYYKEKGINDIVVINEIINKCKENSNPYLKWSDEELKLVIEKRKKTYYEKSKEEREKINKSRGFDNSSRNFTKNYK